MKDLSNNDLGVLLEQVRDEIKAVHESVADVPTRGEFNELKLDVGEIKEDIKVIKSVLTETNRQVNKHERLIIRFLKG